jgi:hypothetical protein
MSILSAFDDLGNNLLESAATDEYKQLLVEIAEIEADIESLQKEVSDGWTKDFKHQLSDIEDEIQKVRRDLYDLIKSYEIEEFWGYDEDGHKEYNYWTDKDKQREVAMLEATIRKKLEQVEAMHAALEKQLRQDHETAYATQTRNIRAKATARDDKKKRKEELLKDIIEEERPELEELIKKANEYTTASADISKVTFNNGKLYLALTSDTETIEIDYWDDIDYDDDYASVNMNKLEGYAEDSALEDGFLFDVAFGLGFDEDAVNNIEFTFGNKSITTVDIPGSSWKLLTGCDMDCNEPRVSVHYDEVEVDEDFEYTITCYLVKEI